jgi:hypothetical protein
MKPKCLFLFWMGLVCLTACGQSQQATVLPGNSATETRSAEIPTLAFTHPATNFVTETATPTATRTPVPTATDFPRATPLAWQSEALTDGVILYTSREQDNVIEKIDRESPLPEVFFSQEECCLMLYTGKMTSPDRKYAAIVTGADELLVTDGQTQISANLDKLNAIDIVYWPNNEQVFLWPKDYDSPLSES